MICPSCRQVYGNELDGCPFCGSEETYGASLDVEPGIEADKGVWPPRIVLPEPVSPVQRHRLCPIWFDYAVGMIFAIGTIVFCNIFSVVVPMLAILAYKQQK